MAKIARLILGDQLNQSHSWFKTVNPSITYMMMEILPETVYVTHHIQKIAGFFAAMRRFAQQLRTQGHTVAYLQLDDEKNRQSFEENIRKIIRENNVARFEYQLPDEYRLDRQLNQFAADLEIPVQAYDSEHFLTSREAAGDFFKNRKRYVMEDFYRHIRRKFNILMDGSRPVAGRWNFDAENRKSLPPNITIKPPLLFCHDVSSIVRMIRNMGVKTIGNIDPQNFPWPISRSESLQLLDFFLEHYLQHFGKYQDAMATETPFVYHSRLSFAMNIKLLHPLEIVERTVAHWQQNTRSIDIAQVEGFIRQIIGWREYMRGIYWDCMPEYESLNFFGHQNKLPEFYWNGETKMNCLHHAITQSLEKAYAHHIQRLMITGNFANLLGVHPDAVDEWYLGIYIDAIQWVEITNTRGMSQFADGGIAATKPYVSSANYIHKMSNYCRDCYYDRTKRYGDRACPFNSLYWDFFDRHREKLAANHRVGMAYRILERMAPEELEKIRNQAQSYKITAGEL